MRQLAGQLLLQVWESCQGRHPIDQVLVILVAALPDVSPEQLSQLTIGQRDAKLLNIYGQSFGLQLDGLVNCPECGEILEFSLNVAQLRQAAMAEVSPEIYELESNGYTLSFRLPNSLDLAALVWQDQAGSNTLSKRALLMERCLLRANYNDDAVEITTLPEGVVTALAARMAQLDPLAEISFDFQCPRCNCAWQVLFDIIPFLWAKISAQAKRLLYDIHSLALAYGWSETEILTISEARRQFYLNMVR